MDDTDSALVRRFQGGDMAAFEEFIQRNQQRLFRLANTFLYDRSVAEDAVQEVFIRAYKGLHRFRFRSQPFTWLYRTLKNVCVEFNRKKTVHGNTESPGVQEDETIQLAHRQALQAIVDSLPELSRRERDVVLLRVFEEFSEKETATILGVRNGTVKTLLHRGLKKLQARHGALLEQ